MRRKYTLQKDDCNAMLITFTVGFQTNWGQQIFIVGNDDALGNNNDTQAVPLQYVDEHTWSIQLKIKNNNLHYKYFIKNANGTLVYNAIPFSLHWPKKQTGGIFTYDTWVGTHEPITQFLSKPFTEIFYYRKSVKKNTNEGNLLFVVSCPQLLEHETLYLLGDHAALGTWDVANAIPLQYLNGSFQAAVHIANGTHCINYKYLVKNNKTGEIITYEIGENRLIHVEAEEKQQYRVHDGFVRLPLQHWRGAGVAIPVFSLRSKNSFGVGEFTDLVPLANWCKKVGLKLIQLLPINDTIVTKTNNDSYPYAANSSFALHPLYINIHEVGTLPKDHKLEISYLRTKNKLNKLDAMDYQSVIKFKLAYLKELYLADKNFTASSDFITFFNQNKYWLQPYAAYCYLRDKNKTVDFTQWGKFADATNNHWQTLTDEKAKQYSEVAFWYFVQYHAHVQLKKAVAHCHKNGIAIKGDLPIGIGRTSCDAWLQPHLFCMDKQAGAPPDDFAVKGQNWGFPTYNWDAMAQDGFQWWKNRFAKMSDYFDAFRIDHILGFFRIWSIPIHAIDGIMGHFVSAIPVSEQEFAVYGIQFDHQRFTTPHFSRQHLEYLFGENSFSIIDNFFEFSNGYYVFKSAFDTQQKLAAYFANSTVYSKSIQSTLIDCHNNVIVFKDDKQSNAYHFNYAMKQSHTYQCLDGQQQYLLNQLYINYFYERQDNFWEIEANKKLPILQQTTNMLICGEDLGMVPHCVPGVMKNLSMLTLEVQRMPKASGSQFVNLQLTPYLSVCTPSTHDMSTIREWWEEDRQTTQQYYNHQLGHFGAAPHYCESWIAKDIIKAHLQSPSMWSIFQLQDLMAMDADLRRENPKDERINVPANPNHYWCYRMHIKLEDLQKEETFNTNLHTLIQQANRI